VVLQSLGGAGLVKAKTIGIDATTLEANAVLRLFASGPDSDATHGSGRG